MGAPRKTEKIFLMIQFMAVYLFKGNKTGVLKTWLDTSQAYCNIIDISQSRIY